MLDRFPNLKVLVSHAGGVLPWLQGRLDSCVGYEKSIRLAKKKPSDYLADLYYDAIIYNEDCLEVLLKTVGPQRIMYGTDHPFFPPAAEEGGGCGEAQWKSAIKIQEIMEAVGGAGVVEQMRWGTASELFGLGELGMVGSAKFGAEGTTRIMSSAAAA